MDNQETQKDNTSEIMRKFQAIAVNCVAPLRKISDAGDVLCPTNVGEVQDLIVKALGKLYFIGLEE